MLIIIIISAIAVCVLVYLASGIRRAYEAEVQYGLKAYNDPNPGILTLEDIERLPAPVQKYLAYAGVIGKPKVWNFKVVCEGRMKASSDKWMKITTVQYNFIKKPTRMYYLKADMSGIPCYGLHAYKHETGTMLVKILGLIPVVNGKGKEMNEGDCVTLFNDMCLVAPASLIDERITWETVDDLTAKATFTNGSIAVSALLYFNANGELVNFVSDDRYLSGTGATYQKLRWSTPVKDYAGLVVGDVNRLPMQPDRNGVKLASYAEAVWTMPDGTLLKYAEFNIKSVEYNGSELK